jgi:hypothetical protein
VKRGGIRGVTEVVAGKSGDRGKLDDEMLFGQSLGGILRRRRVAFGYDFPGRHDVLSGGQMQIFRIRCGLLMNTHA